MMHHPLILVLLVIATSLVGCNKPTGDYIAVSSISNHGFARNEKELQRRYGQEIQVWGFVDHSNMYGNKDVKEILGEWWSGDGSSTTTWSFNLKANEDDKAGSSFSVCVPNDQGRDNLLRTFLADARAKRSTKVFVKGKLFTFNAPTNLIVLKGLYMKVQSSQDILIQLPGTEAKSVSGVAVSTAAPAKG